MWGVGSCVDQLEWSNAFRSYFRWGIIVANVEFKYSVQKFGETILHQKLTIDLGDYVQFLLNVCIKIAVSADSESCQSKQNNKFTVTCRHLLLVAVLAVVLTYQHSAVCPNTYLTQSSAPVQRPTVCCAAPDRHALCQRGSTGSSQVANCNRWSVFHHRWTTSVEHSACFCSRHKLVLALQKTPENVSLCLTATAPVALNWRL